MRLLEFQGKRLLAEAGIGVPTGDVASTPQEAYRIAEWLGVPVAVKAQVQSGKRGKAGAIRLVEGADEASDAAEQLLGVVLGGSAVERVLVEQQVVVARELYGAVLGDPATRGPLVLFSQEGGMEIEEVSAQSPHKVGRFPVDIRKGPAEADMRAELVRTGLTEDQCHAVASLLVRLYSVYRQTDAELVEVNPLALTPEGGLLALDAKVSLDAAGTARRPELAERFAVDLPQTGTRLEREARAQGFLFIELDGDVGVLANGAGLTMATLDAVSHFGGKAANFLEIGGDSYTKALPALRLVLSNPRVQSLLVNFCGAFARTDVMAEGVVAAIEHLRPTVPISFTIHGTGEDEAVQLVRKRLGIEPYKRMEDAVRAAVAGTARAARSRQEWEALDADHPS